MTYIVKTHTDRNLLISADSFELRAHDSVYVFTTTGKIVASIPKRGVLAIVEDTASEGDFYQHSHLDNPAEELLERAVDILVESEDADEDSFWPDFFAYAGIPEEEVTAPEETTNG